MDGGKAAGLHERKRIGKFLLGFAGEADDEVGSDGAVGEMFVEQADAFQIPGGVVFAIHTL